MSRWRLEWPGRVRRLTVALDSEQAAWHPPGEARPHVCPHHALPAALAGLSRSTLVLVASNDIAVHWIQSPPTGLASLAELRQVAQARCAQLFGGTPGTWRVAADWQAGRPFACAALPRALVEPIEQRLQAAGIPAQWHTAWSLLAARAADRFPAEGWSVLRSPRRLLAWHCRAGQVQRLAGLPVSPGATPAELAATASTHIRLEAARDPACDAAAPPRWLDLCGPATLRQPLPAWCAAGEAQATLALALALEGTGP